MEEILYSPIELTEEGSFTINNSGTAPAPCVVTIVPMVDFMMCEIKGLSREPIKVSNIKANQVLVIDGEKKIVTVDDQDWFRYYDGWEFPKLMSGPNEVSITNGAMAQIAIEFNRRYI